MSTGSRASGQQRSVTTVSASTRMPPCTATRFSGTSDMPTTSAPIPRRKRYSAAVSRFGPGDRDEHALAARASFCCERDVLGEAR